MKNISRTIKLELFRALIKEEDVFGKDEIVVFLDDVWDLRTMSSEDARYTDAYGDVVQHMVNNDDWEIDYLFIERLKLLDDDEKFISFLETIVSKKYSENEDDIN